MNQILEILNDRITVNAINGKREAVAALVEFREAMLAKPCACQRALLNRQADLARIERMKGAKL